jgi:hypothetical protein
MERVFRVAKQRSPQTRQIEGGGISPEIRLRIRFPIQLPDGTVYLGALGFDANKIQNQIDQDLKKIKQLERDSRFLSSSN